MKNSFCDRSWLIALSLCFALGSFTLKGHDLLNYSKHFVRVVSYKQESDVQSPWKKKNSYIQNFIGSIVNAGGKRILCTAKSVENTTLIEMIKLGEHTPYKLKVVFVDFEANLALLEPVDKQVLESLDSVKISDDLYMEEEVELLSFKNNELAVLSKGVLSRFELRKSQTSAYSVLHAVLKMPEKNFFWSEPVLRGQKLVGFAVGQGKGIVYVLPSRVLMHFLRDRHKTNSYAGFSQIGIRTRSLISPYFRQHLGLDNLDHGVRIKSVEKTSSAFKILKSDDVLTGINDYKISKRGYIKHPVWGHVFFSSLLIDYYPGDEVRLELYRNKKLMKMNVKLSSFSSNNRRMHYYRHGKKERHLIFSGFVFQSLHRDYLKLWGSNWANKAHSNLVYLWKYRNPVTTSNKRIVILNRVLPDSSNIGYERLGSLIIDKVNGKKINSLDDLRKQLAKPLRKNGEDYAVISFTEGQGEAILSYQGLAETHKRIAKLYSVYDPKSFFQKSQ